MASVTYARARAVKGLRKMSKVCGQRKSSSPGNTVSSPSVQAKASQSYSVDNISEDGCFEGHKPDVLVYDSTTNYVSADSNTPSSVASGLLSHTHHISSRQLYNTKSNHVLNRHRGSSWGENDKVTLLVDGKRFIISPTLLIKHPNTMLGR